MIVNKSKINIFFFWNIQKEKKRIFKTISLESFLIDFGHKLTKHKVSFWNLLSMIEFKINKKILNMLVLIFLIKKRKISCYR
jgi:hypothetical protein